MTNQWIEWLSNVSRASFSTPIILCGLLLFVVLGLGVAADIFLVAAYARRRPDWSECARQMRARFWTWREAGWIVFTVALLLLVLSVCASARRHILSPLSHADETVLQFVSTVAMHALAIGIIIVFMRSKRMSWKNAFGLDQTQLARDAGWGVLFYLAALPVFFLVSLAYLSILFKLNYPVQRQEVLRWLIDPNLPLWFKVLFGSFAAVIAPITEEMLFRGIVQPALSKWMSAGRAVVLVSVFFALIHAHLPALIPLFVLACALSLAYLYSRSILVPIVMHAAFNTVSMTAQILLRDVSLGSG